MERVVGKTSERVVINAEEKSKKAKLEKSKGITLIALVITIIVLLILAGITIASITGENGILSQATRAKEETEKATDREQRELAMLEASTNFGNTTYKGVTIPAGFAPTRIEGESTVDEGLVIIDSKGNEFVWIPCKYTKEGDEADNNVVYYNGSNNETDTREENWKDKQYYYNGGTWYDYQPHNEGKTSVEKYGGFYVARYEAGVPSGAPFYASKQGDVYYTDEKTGDNTDKTKDTDKYVPVSKKGQQAWNFISQTNAKKVAEKMIDNENVKSYLIDSHAWNTICKVIQKKDTSKDILKSSKWGNFKNNTTTKYENIKGLWAQHVDSDGVKNASNYNYGLVSVRPDNIGNDLLELATGSSEDFKAYNIYDMAGNMWEWTTETGNHNNADSGDPTCNETECPTGSGIYGVLRGGGFDKDGDNSPIVRESGYFGVAHADVHFGFRAVLYMK